MKMIKKLLIFVILVLVPAVTAAYGEDTSQQSNSNGTTSNTSSAPLTPEETQQKAGDAAKDFQVMFDGMVGDKEKMKNNALNPILDPTLELKTFDGTRSGSVAMSGETGKEFLRLSVIPDLTTGNIKILVSQDLTLTDTPVTPPGFPISGISAICMNGFLRCAAGGNGCQASKWAVSGDGYLQAAPTTMTDMANCYCINNVCGRGQAVMNMPVVLRDLGGGAQAALAAWDNSLVLTSAPLSEGTISYMGRRLNGAIKTPGTQVLLPPDQQPRGYLAPSGSEDVASLSRSNSFAQVQASATDEVTSQTGVANSYYNFLMNSPSVSNSSFENRICKVTRRLSVSQTQNYCDEPLTPGTLADNEITSYYKVPTYCKMNGGGMVSGVTCSDGVMWKNQDDTFYPSTYSVDFVTDAYNNAQVKTPTEFNYMEYMHPAGTSTEGPPNRENAVAQLYKSKTKTNAFGNDPQQGFDYVEFSYHSQCIRYYDQLVESQEDTAPSCTSLAQDPKCTLLSEKTDGVTTVRNGIETGFVRVGPDPAQNVPGYLVPSYKITRPFFEIERTYRCDTTAVDYHLEDAISRANTTRDTTVVSDNTMTYGDRSGEPSGRWTTDSSGARTWHPAAGTGTGAVTRNVKLAPIQEAPDAEKTCKVKKPKMDTRINMYGNAQEFKRPELFENTVTSTRICNPDCKINEARNESIKEDCPPIVPDDPLTEEREDEAERTCTVTSTQTVNPTLTYEFYYRTCDPTCPIDADAGEIIVTPCTDASDFFEAASALTILRDAAKDMICSGGASNPDAPPPNSEDAGSDSAPEPPTSTP